MNLTLFDSLRLGKAASGRAREGDLILVR